MKLDLMDLVPAEAKLVLSEKPGKIYVLNKITLRTRVWLQERFKDGELANILKQHKIPEISEICYYLLKDKSDFPTLESFQEACVTMPDFVALIQALLATIGISEPMIKQLSEQDEGNEQSPDQPIGAQSSIQSPASTVTA